MRESADDRRDGRPFPFVAGVEHRFVQTGRIRMHVAEAGQGDALLLLHGWAQHWYAWRKIIPLLSAHHRLISPDLRGCGWSEVPARGYSTAELVDDVVALLDALKLERVLLAGHELGGRVGFHLSLKAPGRVRAHFALNAMHPYWSPRRVVPAAWREWWTPFVETPLLGRLVLRRVPAFTRMLYRLGYPFSDTRTDLAADEFIAALREPGRARAAEAVQRRFAYRELIPTLLGVHKSRRLTVPTLMLNGTRDFALSTRELGGHERYADDLTLRLVPGGHFLPEELPQHVAETALAFFATHSRPNQGATRRPLATAGISGIPDDPGPVLDAGTLHKLGDT